mgnify:CR=1 FL=1
MGVHDAYGKRLLVQILGKRFNSYGDVVKVRYDGGITANIDGVIENACAIEIESRTDKQIRGAVLDLVSHPLARKLLIIIPANMHNPKATIKHCEGLLSSLIKPDEKFRVVLLKGTGHTPEEIADRLILKSALKKLDCL